MFCLSSCTVVLLHLFHLLLPLIFLRISKLLNKFPAFFFHSLIPFFSQDNINIQLQKFPQSHRFLRNTQSGRVRCGGGACRVVLPLTPRDALPATISAPSLTILPLDFFPAALPRWASSLSNLYSFSAHFSI